MLKAARAQGIPTTVMAIMTAAISQPNAISAPPKRIQSTLRKIETGRMGASSAGTHPLYRGAAAQATVKVCWRDRCTGSMLGQVVIVQAQLHRSRRQLVHVEASGPDILSLTLGRVDLGD